MGEAKKKRRIKKERFLVDSEDEAEGDGTAAPSEQPSRGKKRRADGDEKPQEAGAEVPAQASTVSKADKKKNKKNKSTDSSPVADAVEKSSSDDRKSAKESPKVASQSTTSDEARETQRKVQQLVMKLRGEGKSEKEIQAAKHELKQSLGSTKQPNSKRAQKIEAWKQGQLKIGSKSAEEQRKDNATRKHELVVIPVVWRGRTDKEDVVEAAKSIKACIAQQNVDVWLDDRRQYTPGQKFAHWEHRGVMLRIEVGPKDLEQGVCCICKAKEPGEYKTVERQKVPLPPGGTRKLLLQLKEWGLSKIDIDRRKGDSDDDEPLATEKVTNEDDDDLAGNYVPRVSKKQKKKNATS